MKKFLISLFLILLITTKASAITYIQASKQNKPIVILFVMTGCSACKQFKPLLNQFKPKYATKYIFVEENITYSVSAVAQRLNVNMAPSLFILEPKKNKVREMRYECMMNIQCLDGALKSYK